MHINPVFYASKLIPYYTNVISNWNSPNPPLIEVKGYDEYKVKKILNS